MLREDDLIKYLVLLVIYMISGETLYITIVLPGIRKIQTNLMAISDRSNNLDRFQIRSRFALSLHSSVRIRIALT